MSHADALHEIAVGLERLADPTELAGFGDADREHNDTPEMRARLSIAAELRDRMKDVIALRPA